MNLTTLMHMTEKAPVFESSPQSIWTDPWISRKLLAAQLDERTDAASRSKSQRDRVIQWIDPMLASRPSRILDLGCGPGLYTKELAARGHTVCGIDISGPAIDHARRSAEESDLKIDYRRGNYLEEDFGHNQDLVMMIYCDLGALSPSDSELVLRKARHALVPDGLLVFDVFGSGLVNEKKPGRRWYTSNGPGFWSGKPHLVLEEIFSFPEDHTFVNQSLVLSESEEEPALYRTWDRWFDTGSLEALLYSTGFVLKEIRNDLVAPNDFAPSDVLFVAARPIKEVLL